MVQKIAALGILAAAIMTDETVLIEESAGCPGYQCTLRGDGEYRSQGRADYRHAVMMNSAQIGDVSVDYEYIKRIRASYYLIGAHAWKV